MLALAIHSAQGLAQMDYRHHATPESMTTDYLRALTKQVHNVLKAQLGVALIQCPSAMLSPCRQCGQRKPRRSLGSVQKMLDWEPSHRAGRSKYEEYL
jgi:hypothetical protein